VLYVIDFIAQISLPTPEDTVEDATSVQFYVISSSSLFDSRLIFTFTFENDEILIFIEFGCQTRAKRATVRQRVIYKH